MRTTNASVTLEYHITYANGRVTGSWELTLRCCQVCLAIEKQEIVLNDFTVTVSETGNRCSDLVFFRVSPICILSVMVCDTRLAVP